MKVVALVAWSNGTISMDEKSVLDIEDALAAELIAQGICADASTYFGGDSGGAAEYINFTAPSTCDHTYAEVLAAYEAGKVLIARITGTVDGNTTTVETFLRKANDSLFEAGVCVLNGSSGSNLVFIQVLASISSSTAYAYLRKYLAAQGS